MPLSEYELKRLENIKRNREILASLNVPQNIAAVSVGISDSSVTTAHSPVKRTRSVTTRTPVESLRKSSRLQSKQSKDYQHAKDQKHMELEDLLKSRKPFKEKRSRSASYPHVPFEPEEGATEAFIETAKRANSHITAIKPSSSSPQRNLRPFTIAKGEQVIKVVPSRIYTIAIHPSPKVILASAGDKVGHLGFLDASSFWNDAGSPRYFLFKPHDGAISGQQYNPQDSSQLFTSSYDGSISSCNLNRGTFDRLYEGGKDYQQQIITSLDRSESGDLLYFSDTDGALSILDRRKAGRPETFQLHSKKMGGVSLDRKDENYLASCSLENVVCIWDLRMLSATAPIRRFEYKRAVTAVAFHPSQRDCIVSTCYDDTVRIHRKIFLSEDDGDTVIRHNNQTGRWITTFKACWDPKSSTILVGNMNRGLDVIDDTDGHTFNYLSEHLTSQPAVNAAHPHHDIVLSGTATGKLAFWQRSSSS